MVNYAEQKNDALESGIVEDYLEIQADTIEGAEKNGAEETWMQKLQKTVTEIEVVENDRMKNQADMNGIEKEVEDLKNRLADYQERYEYLIELRELQVQQLNELKTRLRVLADDSSY